MYMGTLQELQARMMHLKEINPILLCEVYDCAV